MARPKKDEVQVEVLRDGVFVAEDVRMDKGDKATVAAELAQTMKESGLVRIL